MARAALRRPRRHVLSDSDDSDDDEFPDVTKIPSKAKKEVTSAGNAEESRRRLESRSHSQSWQDGVENAAKQLPAAASAVRRRKLGQISDNPLLRAWTPEETSRSGGSRSSQQRQRADPEEKENRSPSMAQRHHPRVELRTRRTNNTTATTPSHLAGYDEILSELEEEVTITEDLSSGDDDDETFQTARSGRSAPEDDSGDSDEGQNGKDDDDDDASYDDWDDSLVEIFPQRPPAKSRSQVREKKPPASSSVRDSSSSDDGAATRNKGKSIDKGHKLPSSTVLSGTARGAGKKDLADNFSRLRLDDLSLLPPPSRQKPQPQRKRETTPPDSPPPQERPQGLKSPKKMDRIPKTPHRASSDMFWSRDFVDDWNDEHSPRKQLFPDAIAKKKEAATATSATITTDTNNKKPTKTSKIASERAEKKAAASKAAAEREAKKAFAQTKHTLAEAFLLELDTVITQGRLSELAASTGGIQLKWTNKLNTTAGRANWKRETIRSTSTTGGVSASGKTNSEVAVKHKHHAHIELAEKVIDDEHRLLNVIAHEFCHLANFMITGLTTNPHGKEFKGWAAKVTAAFGESRGIEVTTKHSYDIDFKYVWECVECLTQFKRHSKSIDPARHRCGACKSTLKQIKPTPRGTGGAGAAGKGGASGAAGGKGGDGTAAAASQPKKPSEYQIFMKEQMKAIRLENPGSPQKDIMRLVASRWAENKEQRLRAGSEDVSVDSVSSGVKGLSVKG